MQISAINGYNYINCGNNVNTNFSGLIKDKSALPIIEKLSKDEIKEFNKIKKRISKTKFWDMKISSIGNMFNEFKFHFINKIDRKRIITEGIYPYDIQGRSIRFYTVVYGAENTSSNTIGVLNFKTDKRAEELYNKYHQDILYARNRGHNITPLESLKMKEVELKMLEESYKFAEKSSKLAKICTEIHFKNSTGNGLGVCEE